MFSVQSAAAMVWAILVKDECKARLYTARDYYRAWEDLEA